MTDTHADGGGGFANGPLIVQSDQTLLLEVDHLDSEACRGEIATFAELERSPEHVHTYRVTPLGLWNARAAGIEPDQLTEPTPCPDFTVADLRRHILGWLAFFAAASTSATSA